MALRRYISLFCALFLFVTASAQLKIIPRERIDSIANPPLAANATYMHFERTRIDAGRMSESDPPLTFEYVYSNTGKNPMTVSRLVSTCSCATAKYDRMTVAPGSKGVIYVRYNPKGHPGIFERRVYVYTDDNKQPSAVLRLSVEVKETKN